MGNYLKSNDESFMNQTSKFGYGIIHSVHMQSFPKI